MKLDHNSLSARLYRWFYQVYDMPSNLCPYFWKLAFMYLVIIPYSIIVLPKIIFKNDPGSDDVRIISSLLIWAMAFFGFTAIYSIVTYLIWGVGSKDSLMLGLQKVGLIALITSTVVLIMLGIFNIKPSKRNQKRIWSDEEYDYIDNPDYRPSFFAITKEFIKAKYYKYCPKIDWTK